MPAPGVVIEDLDDDVCLYRPDIDEVLVLNREAGDIWRLADGDLTVDEIAHRLAGAYQRTVGDLQSQVADVVDDLTARGYLVTHGPAETA